MRDIALVVPLTAFTIVRRGQCGDLRYAGAEVFGDPFDRAALTRGVAALENHHHTCAASAHPLLELYEFRLQTE